MPLLCGLPIQIKVLTNLSQCNDARWVARDYHHYTSSVSAMLQDLNWRTLDQQRLESRLVILYKVTYDLAAIPASDYLILRKKTFSSADRQITTPNNYFMLTRSPTDNHTLERPTTSYTHPPYPGTVQHSCLSGNLINCLNANICFIF